MTWFLIDDDPDDQDIFLLAIEKIGKSIDCVTAKDGVDALKKLGIDTFIPDCIILDLNMPFMDGVRCLTELKKIERLKGIPVFIYSTSSESKLKERLMQLGAAGYIVKPSSMVILAEILNNLYRKLNNP